MSKNKPLMYEILVYDGMENRQIFCPEGASLLDALSMNGIRLASACGGSGYCGQCRIRLLAGELAVTTEDRKFFTNEKLAQGWRLACKAYPAGNNCAIEIKNVEEAFEVVTDHDNGKKIDSNERKDASDANGYLPNIGRINRFDADCCGIAIDIGTSTLAASLVSIEDGRTLGTYSAVNPQRVYGADVIARIQAANSGKLEILRELLKTELLCGICDLVERAAVDKKRIKKLAIACNTTMGHILLGYSCEGLGRYPYTPVNLSTVELTFSELFNSDYLKAPVTVMPGISTFVGGDIVAGLLSCSFDKLEKACLFIDLGTNGEIALGNKDRILVSSSAAGPAFEGGNISCGTGSIAGAICSIDIADGKTGYRTISDKEAVGICGTGIIELASELLKEGFIDETGLLVKEFFKDGFPIKSRNGESIFRFTQKDIRQLQLAKAAVRAGMDILIKEYGIGYEDIDNVYLAGGFGFRLNLQKAANIGLLPGELLDRIKLVGNAALSGAIAYLLDRDAPLRLAAIIKAAKELALAEYEEFNSLYPEYMYFR